MSVLSPTGAMQLVGVAGASLTSVAGPDFEPLAEFWDGTPWTQQAVPTPDGTGGLLGPWRCRPGMRYRCGPAEPAIACPALRSLSSVQKASGSSCSRPRSQEAVRLPQRAC